MGVTASPLKSSSARAQLSHDLSGKEPALRGSERAGSSHVEDSPICVLKPIIPSRCSLAAPAGQSHTLLFLCLVSEPLLGAC